MRTTLDQHYTGLSQVEEWLSEDTLDHHQYWFEVRLKNCSLWTHTGSPLDTGLSQVEEWLYEDITTTLG